MSSKTGYEKGGFWARVLIIAYGLGIVALGSYPFQRQYGGVVNYLKQQSLALAGEGRRPAAMQSPRYGLISEPPIRALTLPEDVEQQVRRSKRLPMNQSDYLTREDRAELNRVMDGL